jgi:2-amino-4-hydroxy-6-hydroxymethyldihydropteridine diphosphokinase
VTRIYLGLGSNIAPEKYLPAGLRELGDLLGQLACSPIYEGEAIGFIGDPFWNLVVSAETSLPVGDLQAALRQIEYRHGRALNAPRFSPRALDIDILTYGDRVGRIDDVALPRPEIVENAFVLRPLAEVAPDARHPVIGATYAELWAAFDQASQPLVRVELGSKGAVSGSR